MEQGKIVTHSIAYAVKGGMNRDEMRHGLTNLNRGFRKLDESKEYYTDGSDSVIITFNVPHRSLGDILRVFELIRKTTGLTKKEVVYYNSYALED